MSRNDLALKSAGIKAQAANSSQSCTISGATRVSASRLDQGQIKWLISQWKSAIMSRGSAFLETSLMVIECPCWCALWSWRLFAADLLEAGTSFTGISVGLLFRTATR
ncbi:hypothetical protein RRG08_008712 [Elysia crispata]|uniref:Uncharacterized protein n=1 Tax=Elysia crispata TaxID=231223 RepID=A0AAE1CJV6_9GAST|nr:hypothetical protein RRG08_008712 [Elysia crispata]